MKTRFGLALASVMLLGSIGSAYAADMAVKAAPPLPPPAPNWLWTGFYVGGNVGGIWNDTRDDVYPTGCFFVPACSGTPVAANPARSDSVSLNGSGFTGGVQAGYNWQSGRFVGGIEADINYSGINDSNSINRAIVSPFLAGNFVHSETEKLQWFGTFRGRAGFTVTPSFLLYATGGLAFGQVKSVSNTAFTTTTDVYTGSLDETRVGWTVGGGGEWMIGPNWSVKAEYLYIDLGKTGYTQRCITAVCVPFVPAPTYQTDLRVRENVARVGVNYHFGGPVVAKY
jgi:outer membrane immunogenic protein